MISFQLTQNFLKNNRIAIKNAFYVVTVKPVLIWYNAKQNQEQNGADSWWRKLGKKLDKHKTNHKLNETICMVIADWMETNKVDIDKQIFTEISWRSDYSRKYWMVSHVCRTHFSRMDKTTQRIKAYKHCQEPARSVVLMGCVSSWSSTLRICQTVGDKESGGSWKNKRKKWDPAKE